MTPTTSPTEHPMRIEIRTTSRLPRLAFWFGLTLFAVPCVAGADGHHRARRAAAPTSAAQERFIVDCVHERTGPDGGITTKAALKLCTGIVKHNAKIAKAKARAAKAIEACEQAVVDACVDAADGVGSSDCEDGALRASFDATCLAREGK